MGSIARIADCKYGMYISTTTAATTRVGNTVFITLHPVLGSLLTQAPQERCGLELPVFRRYCEGGFLPCPPRC